MLSTFGTDDGKPGPEDRSAVEEKADSMANPAKQQSLASRRGWKQDGIFRGEAKAENGEEDIVV
jgi:hypothetical protein